MSTIGTHPVTHFESHGSKHASRLNWLRASVLGANDGIVSTASIIAGVAAATDARTAIIAAGVAGLSAGALSMAAGEYVSVSSQRDTEKALLDKERHELRTVPEKELLELAHIYEKKGLTKETATLVAQELTAHDAFRSHAEAELGIDPDELTDPWHAAWASGLAFTAGGIVPLCAVVLAPHEYRWYATILSVFAALCITGTLSAYVGGAGIVRATVRVVLGGFLAMVITYSIGSFFGIDGM